MWFGNGSLVDVCCCCIGGSLIYVDRCWMLDRWYCLVGCEVIFGDFWLV